MRHASEATKREPLKGRLVGANDSNPSNSSPLSVAKVLKELDNLSESMAQSDRRGNDCLRSPIHRSGSEVSESYQNA